MHVFVPFRLDLVIKTCGHYIKLLIDVYAGEFIVIVPMAVLGIGQLILTCIAIWDLMKFMQKLIYGMQFCYFIDLNFD